MQTLLDAQVIHNSLLNLTGPDGIHASGRDEVYGCIFGRDSAISILKILRAHKKSSYPTLLELCKKTLLTLRDLQGQEINIENGEQPGKFIHEWRKDKYSHLLALEKPWFLWEGKELRNYDSIDSTALILIAIYRYWEVTKDNEFLISMTSSVEKGINWIITYGDMDKDILLEYDFPLHRKYGGLKVQSWTDSHESLLRPDGSMPPYPIASVEVQASAWLALKLWAKAYKTISPTFAHKLDNHARDLKSVFNNQFIFKDNGLFFASQALDGNKTQINTVTANPLICLWAADQDNGQSECIVDADYIPDFVKRLFMSDLFVEDAGVRTMSSLSSTFNPNQDSYHNGSFWPMLNGLITEGLENFGYYKEAFRLKEASLIPIHFFNSPIELYVKQDNGFFEYVASSGQVSCKEQAWTAAALLDWFTPSSLV